MEGSSQDCGGCGASPAAWCELWGDVKQFKGLAEGRACLSHNLWMRVGMLTVGSLGACRSGWRGQGAVPEAGWSGTPCLQSDVDWKGEEAGGQGRGWQGREGWVRAAI